MSYDVAIIGAGVSGAMVARELSRYNIKVALVEKCSDMAMGCVPGIGALALGNRGTAGGFCFF